MKPFSYNDCAAFYTQALVHKANLFCPCQYLHYSSFFYARAVEWLFLWTWLTSSATKLFYIQSVEWLDLTSIDPHTPTFMYTMVLFIFYCFICVCVHVSGWVHMCHSVCVEVKGQHAGVLAFHHMISQVYRLDHKCLYLLSPGLCFECKILSMCSYFEYLISNWGMVFWKVLEIYRSSTYLEEVGNSDGYSWVSTWVHLESTKTQAVRCTCERFCLS